MTLIIHPSDATVFSPNLPRSFESRRSPWPGAPAKLVVSVLLHAPYYEDSVPDGSFKPLSMQGGVGRDTGEPLHGQVARLSQWDFGLTVGIFRLLKIAGSLSIPVAVALDQFGSEKIPGLARALSKEAGELVVRGRAANLIIDPSMTEDQERAYIHEAKAAVESATGRASAGWFSPERATSARTAGFLKDAGFGWLGDWPMDERPVLLDGSAVGLAAVPFGLETEDMFALYTRSQTLFDYDALLRDTISDLIDGFEATGPRFLGLNWFGWVLGQACFADVAERTLSALAANPDVAFLLPSDAATLATI